MKERVGFIGAGMMGHGMARNILDKGYSLHVLGHRNRAPVEDLTARGAAEAATASELGADCDIVILCVGNSRQVEDLVLGPHGVASRARPSLTVVDATTGDPNTTRRIAAVLAQRGIDFADAPVTKAPRDAEAGRLNSLVGASDPVFERIEPILKCYSETVTRFGEVGAGQTAKLVNNFITCGYTALIAEGLSVCAAAGVDMRKLFAVMSTGAADSGVMRKLVPAFLDGDLTGHAFAIGNARKDVSYFKSLVDGLGFRSIMISALLETYDEALRLDLGDRLMASLFEMHERRNEIDIVPEKPD